MTILEQRAAFVEKWKYGCDDDGLLDPGQETAFIADLDALLVAEREACAILVEGLKPVAPGNVHRCIREHSDKIATAIRGRK